SMLDQPGITAHSGPFPATLVVLKSGGVTAVAEAQGRNETPASVDQPEVTGGSWVRKGEVVIERTFAGALGVNVGSRVLLNGRSFRVAGLAVTAASPEFPQLCQVGCGGGSAYQTSGVSPRDTGVIWLTEADARSLATFGNPVTYTLNLRLRNPASAPAFINAYVSPQNDIGNLTAWQSIRDADGLLVTDGQQVLLVGSWLLGLLAVASVAVLAGGRAAEETRRVGLLKAVGSSPGLVTAVLLAEYLALALMAAVIGLVVGRQAAPLLTDPGAGLVGAPGAPSLTVSTIEIVVAAALAVALAATLVPAVRAARTSTVEALADSSRSPKRRAWVIALSARLPVPLLLGVRLAARRPRRAVLSAASEAISVTTLVAVLAFHATTHEKRFGGTSGIVDPVVVRDSEVLLVLTVMLVLLAALNAVLTTWSTVLDARHPAAVARALGATPQQVSAGLSAAQLMSALPGAIVGVPLGIELFSAANRAGLTTVPPVSWLVAAVVGTLLVVTLLTMIPARLGSRRSVAETLQVELA
ncbi:MAG TPA: FtsX-like permease family protein, partial [Acidimicrobiales bacterium]|nr:FtsX-like permease family protein [Acidimicrobiales bacterium]